MDPNFDPLGFGGYRQFSMQPQAQPAAPGRRKKEDEKKKGFWLDQISTGGGIGGSLAGGLAGATLGSAVPVLGTAIGGLAGAILGGAGGSAAGEVAENAITGDDLGKNVALEAALGGATALPLGAGLKVGRAAFKAGTGIGKTGARELLEQAGKQTVGNRAAGAAVQQTGSRVGGAMDNAASKMYAQAFTVPRRAAATLKPEQTAKELMQYGVGGSLDKINQTSEAALKNIGSIFDRSVADIGGQVRVGDVTGIANNALKGVKITGPERQALMERIVDIGTRGKMPGYSSPSELLEQIRSLERYGYSRLNAGRSGVMPNPDLEDVGSAYVQVAKELEDNLFSAINKTGSLKSLQTPETAQQLNSIAKGLGDRFLAAKDPKEVRSLMAPFVRARNLVNTTIDEGQSAGSQGLANLGGRGVGAGVGGVVGGLPGAAAGFLAAPLMRGVDEAVRAPIATGAGRALQRGAQMMAGRGAGQGGQSALGLAARQGGSRLLLGGGAGAGITEQPMSLEDAMLDSQAGMGGIDPMAEAMGADTAAKNPYPRENLLADIQRDPANAEEYIAYYNALQEVFAPAEADLSSAQQKQLMGTQAASSIIDQLESQVTELGQQGAEGLLGGTIAGLAGRLNLNDAAKTYEDSRGSTAMMLIKALQGSAGQISDRDRAAIEAAVPSLTDTAGTRQRKIQRLRELAAAYGMSAMGAPSAQPGTLEDAMLGQPAMAF